jgi:hypothetical protein
VLARDSEWSIRVLGLDGSIDVVHTSASRLSPPSWRPGGGVLVFGEQDSAETSRLQLLLLGEPRVLKSLSGSEDLFAARAVWRSGAEFLYTADGQLWRRGIATPTREPVHLNAAALVETAAPPSALAPLDDTAEQPVLGLSGLVRASDGRRSAFTAAAGRVHSSEDRVLTSIKTRQSFSRKIKSISPRSERKFAVRNFMPSRCRYFLAARSPSSPMARCLGLIVPCHQVLIRDSASIYAGILCSMSVTVL